MIKLRRQGDLALVETIAIALTAIALGVIFIPAFLQDMQRASHRTALKESQLIASSLLAFEKDTQFFGKQNPAQNLVQGFYGPGKAPSNSLWPAENMQDIAGLLSDNQFHLEAWKGPYMGKIVMDPWENAYWIYTAGFRSNATEKVWVISAGPNGRIDTFVKESTPSGDDIGVILY